MKKIIILAIIVVLGIILVSIWPYSRDNNVSCVQDINTEVDIEDYLLNVTFVGGNMIDEELSYGNKYEKMIKIENKNDVDLSYSVSFEETVISDEHLTYTISYSLSENAEESVTLIENENIVGDTALSYNLLIENNSVIYLKIIFKANNETLNTKIKGVFKVEDNLSLEDVFLKKIELIQSELNTKIDNLNGINEKGFYIIDVKELSNEVSDEFSGLILINATDISNLEFYYSVYNSSYMLKNQKYSLSNFSKNSINNVDIEYINSITFDNICSLHTNKTCSSFSELSYVSDGGKTNFYNNSIKVINLVKESFNSNKPKVYIYDVLTDIDNDTNIKGYILIDNTDINNPEYYIYLANNYFMISGYNLTKLGDYSIGSSTIRAYTESAFNTSSENMLKVCNFSGFSECYKKTGELIA